MIKFTDLRVQKERLIITAEVREIENYYDNVYIDKIIIDTQDTFKTSGPSANPIYSETIAGNSKQVSLSLSSTVLGDIDIDHTMFFVYAVAKGTPSAATPCGFDNETSIGVTFSMCPIYNTTMGYIKEVDNSCEIPKGFIDMFLQLKAIQYAIDSGHYQQAIIYYDRFFKNIRLKGPSDCGCHG